LESDTTLIHKPKMDNLENVLVMQGGGSLGAYECGVYKTLAKHKIHFDIIAGTSIGAINAALIVGSKNKYTEISYLYLLIRDRLMYAMCFFIYLLKRYF